MRGGGIEDGRAEGGTVVFGSEQNKKARRDPPGFLHENDLLVSDHNALGELLVTLGNGDQVSTILEVRSVQAEDA